MCVLFATGGIATYRRVFIDCLYNRLNSTTFVFLQPRLPETRNMQALTNVIFGLLSPALALRQRHPMLNSIVEAYVYRTYAEYFRAVYAGEEPDHPSSSSPATEKLFTLLWTTIVFREQHELDQALLGTKLSVQNSAKQASESVAITELDELYALAFERMAEIASSPGGSEAFLDQVLRKPPVTLENNSEATDPTPAEAPTAATDNDATRQNVSEQITDLQGAAALALKPSAAEHSGEDSEATSTLPVDTAYPPLPSFPPLPPASAPAAVSDRDSTVGNTADDVEPTSSISTVPAYVLKITLEDTAPPVWRRVIVLGDTSLADLHKIIQSSVGWSNTHLHQFRDRVETYAPPSEYLAGEHLDYTHLTVADVLATDGAVIYYDYDFGDNWSHRVEVERIQESIKDQRYPICTGGRRACPPEDVGGSWGYTNFLEALNDPKDPEREDLLDWAGGEFDPERFDLVETNYRLHSKNFGVFESSNPFLRQA